MTRSVYIASPEGRTGKSAVALGLSEMLAREVGSVGVFRPLVHANRHDAILDALVALPGIEQTYEQTQGVPYELAHSDPDEALSQIVHRFGELSQRFEMVIILGSDYTDVSTPTEFTLNAKIAANLGSPVVLVLSGLERTPDEVFAAAEGAISEFTKEHTRVVAAIANRVSPDLTEEVVERLNKLGILAAAMPETPLLSAPTVAEQLVATEAELLQGDVSLLSSESLGILVCGMTMPNVLDRLTPGLTVVAPSDRSELLVALMMAHRSDTFPDLAAVILVGGYPIPESVRRLITGVGSELPLATTDLGTFATAQRLMTQLGPLNIGSAAKIDTARRMFSEAVAAKEILAAIDVPQSTVRTPLMFEYQLTERARKDRKHIVLPEATDDRILEAAAIVLRRGVADITLLGERSTILERGQTLGFDLSEADIVSTTNPDLVEKFAAEYARLRAHKKVTLAQARDKVTDISCFGTVMVQLGMADGMVSGAINTTAHTIRPALEFVKTKPGVTVVSSVFLMCLADKVVAYGDCAVNPDPSAEQLADIAMSSVETARAFDIEPKVAMLSYSTGESGTGADVDKVRAATALVRQRSPELPLEGPIQYDAAVDPKVAAKKLPDSTVAGQATVFIFPDLNTGNNTYKAVQRTAGAVAIGPVLQGLNKPVNDLSRGALVEDIVNTVAITAIQAQQN